METVTERYYGPDYMLGEVYFVTDGELIKIGYSGSAKVRMKALKSAAGKDLRLLKVVPGTRDDESRFHKLFQHLRVHGEWFRRDPELLAFIEGRPTPEDDEAADEALMGEPELLALLAWGEQSSVPFARGYTQTIANCVRRIRARDPQAEQFKISLELAMEALQANKERRPPSARYNDLMKATWPRQ